MRIAGIAVGLLGLAGCYRDAPAPKGPVASAGSAAPSETSQREDLRAELGGLFGGAKNTAPATHDPKHDELQRAQATGGLGGPALTPALDFGQGAPPGGGLVTNAPADAKGAPPPAADDVPEQKKDADKRGGERRPAPHAATTTSGSGELSADQVDRVVSSNLDAFARCIAVETVVSVRVTVGVDGKVLDVSASRSSPDDAKLRDCVTNAFRTLAFPRVDGDWPSRLAFDLRLTPR